MPIDKTTLEERKRRADMLHAEIRDRERELKDLGDIEITSPHIDFKLTMKGDLCTRKGPGDEYQALPQATVEKLVNTLAPLFGYVKAPA